MHTDDHPLVQELTEWFTTHARSLPWRDSHPGPWGIFVVEVMSQQTPISRVVPVWEEWMGRWPTPQSLANATPAQVIRAWGRMGYPRRALHLHQAATQIVTDHAGQVPDCMETLLSLPGVGHYTAAAVMAFGFGQRSTVLDTNIRRVLSRTLDGVSLPTAHVRSWERQRAQTLVPASPEHAVAWNGAVMEFGALVCTARNPACHECPVTLCAWRDAGFPDNAPNRPTQRWQGTDRQARGAVMAELRHTQAAIEESKLLRQVQHTLPWVSTQRFTRVVTGLIEDSLIEQLNPTAREVSYRLPH